MLHLPRLCESPSCSVFELAGINATPLRTGVTVSCENRSCCLWAKLCHYEGIPKQMVLGYAGIFLPYNVRTARQIGNVPCVRSGGEPNGTEETWFPLVSGNVLDPVLVSHQKTKLKRDANP